ncbi:MocR-like pyridoxine biosynthesis transcription factor PdxR [Undibacterium terreum]|uniref:Transcriptional regulator n=1 Tax=Undibacterium terreum TaxID=1224302 RepID=A0A916XG22_9BURK|nr:PLP-dependent aminotransferase family protein [Undibacterium terreum]GGC70850.1 transcriptional regulator [Undibacterium terreum]
MHQTQLLAMLQLDRNSSLPMFRQLYAAIKQAILNGSVEPGMQLPPTRDFCNLLDISRQTVLNAYAQLLAEGYLQGTVGRGTFVSDQLPPLSDRGRADSKLPEKLVDTASALRPLSQRGQRYAHVNGQMHFHQGGPRAFRVGMPGLDAFPFDVWGRLEARLWRRPSTQLGYGDPAGFRPLREMLAVYLKAARGVNCSPDQIIITSGSQQALFLLSSLLLDPGDAAWMESPGYRGASAPLQAAQARLCPVPVDAQGLSVQTGARLYPDAKLVYTTPSHQLPLGVTMSLQRRLELLAWAGTNKAWIIEDDYDSEYRYKGPTLASLQSLDKAGCVIYVGTLSKVLFPGLRLGYMVVPAALAEPIIQAKAVTDKHTAIGPQMVLADFISEGHFNRHIKRTRDVYAERRHVLLQELQQHMADQLECGPSDAGLDLAVHFLRKNSSAEDEQRIAHAGLQLGTELRPLSHYDFHALQTGQAAGHRPGLLLGFSSIPADEIRNGVATLAKIMRQHPY